MTLPADRLLGSASDAYNVPEPFLPEVENIQPPVRRAHPKQAGPIAIDRHDAVVAEAARVGLIVLKEARKTFRAPVEVRQPQARRHPESILSVVEELAAVQPVAPAPSGYA